MSDNETLASDSMSTICTHCHSEFAINQEQLDLADGSVRCSQCNDVFNAYTYLSSTASTNPNDMPNEEIEPESEIAENKVDESEDSNEYYQQQAQLNENVSLKEAMSAVAKDKQHNKSLKIYGFLSILLLITILATQWVYQNRLQLIKNPDYQSHILNLCKYLPCDSEKFSNTRQYALLERNIFSHPSQTSALLISGSFLNEAPFSQNLPLLKVSLFNLQAEVIGQRIFNPIEYLPKNQSIQPVIPGETIYFQLEVSDPNSVALTYEFEFL